METFSVIIPLIMVLTFVTIVVIMCICVYRRRMMHGGPGFYAPTYATGNISATSYPAQPGYPITHGYPGTATGYPGSTTGYPCTPGFVSPTAYPQHLHVNQNVDYPTGPPSYGECMNNPAFSANNNGFSKTGHDSGGIGFESMGGHGGSSGFSSGGNDFGSSCVGSSSNDAGTSCQGTSSNDF